MMLSDVRLSDVCLSVAYIEPKSRTERPRKTKISTEVAHVTRDSDTTFKVKGQGHQTALLTAVLARQAAAVVDMGTCWPWETVAVCSAAQGAPVPTGEEGWGISWRPPAYSFFMMADVYRLLIVPRLYHIHRSGKNCSRQWSSWGQKLYKNLFVSGLCPRLHWELNSAPSDLLDGGERAGKSPAGSHGDPQTWTKAAVTFTRTLTYHDPYYHRDLTISCLHHLIPPPRDTSVTTRLRLTTSLPRPNLRTKKYCSLINFGLHHYQPTQ